MEAGCCVTPNSAAPAPADDCCDLEVMHQKLSPVSIIQLPDFAFASFSPTHMALWEPLLYTTDRLSQETLRHAGSSPPRYGRHLLYLLQTLLI
jgi:hypothetical protein